MEKDLNDEIRIIKEERNKRLVVGTATLGVGVVLFVVGLFVQPGGTIGILFAAGVGAIMIFLGVASLSQSVAAPVSRIVSNILPLPGRSMNRKTPGRIASRNAQRQPRRTASTASALMIGLALVSTIAVVAASIKQSLVEALRTSVTADFYVSSTGFAELPPAFAERLSSLPELSAVSPFRPGTARINSSSKTIGAVDPEMAKLVNVDAIHGDLSRIGDGGIAVHKDPARDLGLSVGDDVKLTWQNGKTTTLKVVCIYADSSILGNWVVSLDTLAASTTATPNDFFIAAKIADGIDPDVARAAVDKVAAEFPSSEVRDRIEFQQSQEDQLNQLLFIVYSLLVFAIAIAVLGIANTMALSVFERTREFGMLLALGTHPSRLVGLVVTESIALGVVGALTGALIGIALVAITHRTGIDYSWLAGGGPSELSFAGLRFSLRFYPALGVVDVARAIGAVFITSLLAATWPALRASRLQPGQALRGA